MDEQRWYSPIQYMTAVPLIFGRLTADDYEDKVASGPCIDALRAEMEVVENKQDSTDYHDPDKSSIANAVQVFFKEGTATQNIEVEYPTGHRRRRAQGIPLLIEKFRNNPANRFSIDQINTILETCSDQQTWDAMTVNKIVNLFVREE